MAIRISPSSRRPWAFAALLALVGGAPAIAQNDYSQAVIQPVPPAALDDLNTALRDLARDPRDESALLRAGWASIELDDTEAALGFFRRAEAVAPADGAVKAGMAAAMLRLDDPVAAVRLFAEAEASGAPMARYGGDRGLAHDLVGDNVRAQQFYRQALAGKNDPEIVRRLALSLAISGDQRASEAELLPLLQHRDLAAYRTRAFALAILGKGEEAVAIAETMLPGQLSNRMAPYLRYMPRLTRAQQAAAANLGKFPPASEIGRDAPQIAALSGAAALPQPPRGPDARLVPTGEPLGTTARAAPARRARGRGNDRSRERPDQPVATGGEVTVTYQPAPPAVASTGSPVRQAEPADTPPPQPVSAAVARTDEPAPVVVARIEEPASGPPAPAADAPRPSLSISQPPPTPPESPPVQRLSLAEAFADFAEPEETAARAAPGAVDISAIEPARESPKAEEPPKPKPAAKPKPPAHPRRFWVQVATGRDVKALAFDWRRIKREGGDLLAKRDAYTAKWGQTRRLVAGPYRSAAEAQDAVTALKKKDVDSFPFTSEEGEEVTPLK